MDARNISQACGKAIENAFKNVTFNATTDSANMKISLQLHSDKPTDGGTACLKTVTATVRVPVILTGYAGIE
jgi:hypothetical protein